MNRVKEYQALLDGRFVPVSSLTLEQAQNALCDAYDVLEELDVAVEDMHQRLQLWREGEPIAPPEKRKA